MLPMYKRGAAACVVLTACLVAGLFACSRAGRVAPALAPVEGFRTQASSGTLALGQQGKTLYAYVADEDAHMLRVFDVTKGRDPVEHAAVSLPGAPGHVIVHAGRVLLSLPQDNQVLELNASSLAVLHTYETCSEPRGLLADAASMRLLVLCGWGHRLQAFDHRDKRLAVDLDLPREPRAMVLYDSPRGPELGIAHAVGSTMSVVSLEDAQVRSVALGETALIHANRDEFLSLFGWGGPIGIGDSCPPDRSKHEFNQGYSIGIVQSKNGPAWVLPGVELVPMPIAPPMEVAQMPAEPTEFSGYGVRSGGSCLAEPVSAQVRIVPTGNSKAGRAVSGGCMLPRALAVNPTTGSIALACLDTRVQEMELGGHSMPRGPRVGGTGVAYDELGRLLSWSTFEHELVIEEDGQDSQSVRPRTRLPENPVALGRTLFHTNPDKRVSSDGRVCASCHPDGRDDGIVWGAPDGPRQTPMLVGRLAGTAPYGWNGSRPTVATHMEQTMKRLGGHGLMLEEREEIAKYLLSIQPPKSDKSAAPAADTVARGAALFSSASLGCSDCHTQDGSFTNGAAYTFRLPSPRPGLPPEKVATFDTPSLRFVGGTAPYFHDGRYPSLRALLSDHKNPMADVSGLADRDVDALESYLKTL